MCFFNSEQHKYSKSSIFKRFLRVCHNLSPYSKSGKHEFINQCIYSQTSNWPEL